MDPETAAELLILIEPLLTVAMRELGSDASVSGQIDAAIAEVMAVPEIDGQVELVRPKVLYEYADPALEALSPLQKQVLRLGPDNVARLKRYLDEVGRALQGDASDG
ncbi:MAG: DUF3014 domain-containing protein [Pseudomonadales bacterium]|nr:DUF3014 domain-containing protein [Pseudomonadales bacterium]NIX09031.1 DUF3014 domain-containing protein [Pseudomonadales bacterium]